MNGNTVKALFFGLIVALSLGNVELLGIRLYDLLIISLGFGIIIETLFKNRVNINLLRYLAIVFVVLTFDLLGLLFSVNLYNIDMKFVFLQHGRLLLGVSLMVITYRYVSKDSKFYLLLENAFIFASSIIGLIWLMNWLDILNTPNIYWGSRLTMGFEDPNYFGGFLLVPLSFLLGGIFSSSNLYKKLISATVANLILLMILATSSRGAIISAAVPCSLALFLFLRQGLRYAIRNCFALGLVTAMVALAISSVPQMQKAAVLIRERFGYARIATQADQHRQTIWNYAIPFIIEHPWGAGYGSFKQITPLGLTTHNLILESLTEFGIAGGLVFLAFVALLFAKLIKRGISTGIDVAIIGSLGSILLHSMTVSELFNRVFWLVLGLSLGYLEIKRKEHLREW
ncbi:MAG: O-antigen ligase family protein [Deltaproteobacteria bacterium]|nr:O-antigen ligase family protein [Deltaproteobacteria bacterium]